MPESFAMRGSGSDQEWTQFHENALKAFALLGDSVGLRSLSYMLNLTMLSTNSNRFSIMLEIRSIKRKSWINGAKHDLASLFFSPFFPK